MAQLYSSMDPGETESSALREKNKPLHKKKSFLVFCAGLGLVVSTIFVVLIVELRAEKSKAESCAPGLLPSPTVTNAPTNPLTPGFTNDTLATNNRKLFFSLVSNTSIRDFMKNFSSLPHIAGSVQNTKLASDAAANFKAFGWPDVVEQQIPALLENLVNRSINITRNGSTENLFLDEPNLLQQQGYQDALKTSNGYSGAGSVIAPIVWANYGREEDYVAIEQLVNLTGKIVVVRYGKIYRGNKVAMAEARGAVGVIIVMDPADVDIGNGTVLPQGPWATNETVQRGSIYLGEGDPRTPFWPSEFDGPSIPQQSMFNASVMGDTKLATIPVQPIGYGNGRKLLQDIGGVSMPSAWQGTSGFDVQLAGKIGPSDYEIGLSVERDLVTSTITNVIASIPGSEEPDRVILLGSHRDAWTYGAVDPISGHSCMQEIARVLGKLYTEQGWKPRRTIQIASWDAEEYALIGSIEYVEQQLELLRQRAVVYLNLDTAVTGGTSLSIGGSPSLQQVVRDVTQEVDLGESGQNMGSIWDNQISASGSGSDHTGFIQLAGVPILSLDLEGTGGAYEAVYHSNYDSLYWVENFGDPGFHFHTSMTKLVGGLALRFADDNFLPINCSQYASKVQQWVSEYSSNPNNTFANFSFMNKQVSTFVDNARSFDAILQVAKSTVAVQFPTIKEPFDALKLRLYNDRVMGLERVFIAYGKGETGSTYYKHVIFTPSAIDSYGSTVMPLMGDALALRPINADNANFAIGRVAQFIGRAGRFLGNTGIWV